MAWRIVIDVEGEPDRRIEHEVPTPHLHVAIDTVLFREKLFSAKEGSFQMTVQSV